MNWSAQIWKGEGACTPPPCPRLQQSCCFLQSRWVVTRLNRRHFLTENLERMKWGKLYRNQIRKHLRNKLKIEPLDWIVSKKWEIGIKSTFSIIVWLTRPLWVVRTSIFIKTFSNFLDTAVDSRKTHF